MPAKKRASSSIDPLNKHKSDMKKILTIANKAIVTTSLKEKNDMIIELQESFTPIIESFEKHQTILQIKNDELTSMRKKLNESTNLRDTLQRNTGFYTNANQCRINHNDDYHVNSIKSLEDEISNYHQLTYPDKLQEYTQYPEDSYERHFFLVDLNLKRIEELVYSYKKRLIMVEESQESTDIVKSEYGSINDLIEKVQLLEIENRKLKEDEKHFINDSITKRRKFAQLTPYCARSFIKTFKNLIDGDEKTIESYINQDFSVDYEKSQLDFDQLTPDSTFSSDPSHFEASEFGNTTEPEIIAPLLEDENTPEKIEAFNNIVSTVLQTNSKIENEIQGMLQKQGNKMFRNTSRIDKMSEANEILIGKLHQLRSDLEQKNQDVTANAADLHRMAYEKEQLNKWYANNLGNYKRLTESHADLMNRQHHNKKILQLLFEITSTLGNYMLHHPVSNKSSKKKIVQTNLDQMDVISSELPPNQESDVTVSFIQKMHERATKAAIDAENEKLGCTPIDPEDIKSLPFIENHEQHVLTAASFQERLRAKKKVKKVKHNNFPVPKYQSASEIGLTVESDLANNSATNSPQLVKNQSQTKMHTIDQNQILSSVKTTHKANNQKPRYFFGRPRIEIFHALAFASQLAGFTFGVDKEFKNVISKLYLDCLSSSRKDICQRINDFGMPFRQYIAQINMSSNLILVKQKEAVGIQTDPMQMLDEEIQTVQVEKTKPKGKSHR